GVQHIVITGSKIEITREQIASASSPSSPASQGLEEAPAAGDHAPSTAGGGGGRCESILSLSARHDPEPILIGGRVTYTLTFVNQSPDQTLKGVMLKNILPAGMIFVSASHGGSAFGNVILWRLGEIAPGEEGSRTLVTRANFPDSAGSFLTNNNAYLEDGSGRCAWAHESITVSPVSLGDDDGDEFPNRDEIRCGSDPKNAASRCYSADMSETGRAVQRGSEVTFTVTLNRHFSFEGEVTFTTPNSIPGVLWTFGRLSAALGSLNEKVTLPFTIKTTASTRLGVHQVRMHISSGGMRTEKVFILEVLPEGEKAGYPDDGLNLEPPS
ncbi:MAG TPA: hypothetical protein VGB25_08725, partial [Candidatus Binatia bacterium]